MSINGVRTRVVDVLVRGGGLVREADFVAIVAYARARGVSSGEARALLQPAEYLRHDRVLRAHGVGLDDVRLDAGAWRAAEALGRELGIAELFPDLPRARPGGAPAAPAAPARAAAHARPSPAPAGGRALGPPAAWRVETSGAVLTFTAEAGGRTYPAVVLATPAWTDPEPPRDLVAAHAAELTQVTSLPALVAFVRGVVAAERPYLEAAGVTTRYRTERYGLQAARRRAFFAALAARAAGLALPAAERLRAGAALGAEEERLLCDRDYDMECGSHERYWPYWDNYRGALEKLLAQAAPGTDAYLTIKDRLEDVYDRKTVFVFTPLVDERDLEVSVAAALVHRRRYSADPGHRVSLAAGSYPTAPLYEVLEVAAAGLPAALARHAGARIYRDTDEAGTLRLDPGGAALAPELAGHVRARRVPASELGLRPLGPGEAPRSHVPGDWSRDGAVAIAPIEIAWWGHCHNEAPLNAMGVDPRRAVTLYRAERGVPPEQAVQTFTADDVWDVLGALTADHEAGYATGGALGLRPTEVETIELAGSRNDGGHWFLLELDRQGARRVRIDAEVVELWHRSEPTRRYARPQERFRRDLPNPDGTFDPNPDWVDSDSTDDDEITIDCLRRRLTLIASYVTFDASGERVEREDRVEIDPSRDEWVKLADEILDDRPPGGRLAEHWYDARRARYRRVLVTVGADGRRREAAREPEVAVARALARQETAYDSVIDLHGFVTQHMGLPFVLDTSSGLAVWNYPVSRVRIDRTAEVERAEGGARYSYTSYHLRYATMGGPAGSARYIIKRDERGNAVRALALDPMPDFAFRNARWVCAPVAADTRGEVAYNVQALEAGYLTDPARRRVVGDLWRRQAAICYASLAAPAAGASAAADDPVYLFEDEAGELTVLPDAAAFQAAVDADRAARGRGAGGGGEAAAPRAAARRASGRRRRS